ncbi:hypothetical protein GCM10010156_52980 [Planobispora rosea]|uniref:Helicase HerA central domain-containing protein n=1 Tax=Planobispora rosea TaxID=35762 RepID=A0A8J3S791_PLARO|nr:ATP-binding protein [Planobispora rosea]GGS87928.1 hypothetical protein GCM10010156_52980 [Planobispora rosea]GIH88568.1 hypothetical protein Pro02_69760 [Planobispora rosea]
MSDTYAGDNHLVAEVIAVHPNHVRIAVYDIQEFTDGEDPLEVGSYIRIYDTNQCSIIAIIENFSIDLQRTVDDPGAQISRVYIIEAVPLGFIAADNIFERGGGKIAIPPKRVAVAGHKDIQHIYDGLPSKKRFCFSSLSQDLKVEVPVDGDKFFNKHIAIVGSTGAGKSHALARIVQSAVSSRDAPEEEYTNNSHIVIFDLHSEYNSSFPSAQTLNVSNLCLPYWLMNSEELQGIFIESNEEQSHNQVAIFKREITASKRRHFDGPEELRDHVHYDSPVFFDIDEVIEGIREENTRRVETEGTGGKLTSKQGPLYGKLENFLTRLDNKRSDPRLSFLLGSETKQISAEDVLRQFVGYSDRGRPANVTLIDVSGVPFEVLSITVSLISRLLFDFAYFIKKYHPYSKNETPLIVVYEEAHKYAPRSSLSKYNPSTKSIERIAKEGRKYGITLAIVSQRPAEVAETIFSQCSNFVAMRLTNPEDQNYVRRLLPDSLGPLTDALPMLSAGEALLIGDSVVMPSRVQIREAYPTPSSTDIPYLQEWKRPWQDVPFGELLSNWRNVERKENLLPAEFSESAESDGQLLDS